MYMAAWYGRSSRSGELLCAAASLATLGRCRAARPVAQVVRRLAGRPAGEAAPGGPPTGRPARSVGVIFVHGIGNQPPRETLLNWANSIIEVLTIWRREHDETNPTADADRRGPGPAGRRRTPTPALDDRVWVRIAMPRTDDAHPATTWLLTEAYWAGEVRAPAFGQALGYLRSHIGAIIEGIAAGYGLREDARAKRLAAIVAEQPTALGRPNPRPRSPSCAPRPVGAGGGSTGSIGSGSTNRSGGS